MGYIDDASSRVYARFYAYEGTIPAMDSFRHYAKQNGIPYSMYLDKHTTYKSTAKQTVEEEIEGIKPMSEFQRAMNELGVEVIHANSPQAKGRIERTFKTFQDRVIKEMRLQGIKTIAQANNFLEEYLPEYNRRFSKEPESKANMHRPTVRINLDGILCFKKEYVLRNDYTVACGGKLYQVLDRTAAKRVVVEKRLNGDRYITYNGKRLKHKLINHRPIQNKPTPISKTRKAYIRPPEHVWEKPIHAGYGADKRAQKKALKEINELILTNA